MGKIIMSTTGAPTLAGFLQHLRPLMRAEADRAFLTDVGVPASLDAAKLYFRRQNPQGGLSLWMDPLRAAGFTPTAAQRARFALVAAASARTGMEMANVQVAWSRTGGWAEGMKLYVQSEHLGPLPAAPFRTVWAALGATPEAADALAARAAGPAREGVACSIDGAGLPSSFEIYDLPATPQNDCVSREHRDPLGEARTTSVYVLLGASCGAGTIAAHLGATAADVEEVLDALPNPRPGAVGVVKTTTQGVTSQAVSIETVPYRPGVAF